MDDDTITSELPAVPADDANQGEGDRASGRKYDRDAEQFIAEGKVPQAAQEAREFVEADPVGAAKAERDAKAGPPHHASVDELIAKGKSAVERVVDKLRNAIKK